MIEYINVTKTFKEQKVLDNISVKIERGKVNVVIGKSGEGKSVFLKHAVGLLKPDSGKILIDGEDITKISEEEMRVIRTKFGFLFQDAALFDSMTVGDNVAFPLREHTTLDHHTIMIKVEEKLRSVGLKNVAHKYPSQLSGGMRKRVGLARAIILEPQYILYDEPTTGLDPIMSGIVDRLILETSKRYQLTSLAISHDMKAVFEIADNIFMLHSGRIIEQGTPKDIQNSTNPIVQQFIHGREEGPIKMV